jgi:hypothetical protein
MVPGTGKQGLYLVNRRAVCARERIFVSGTGERRLYLANRRADCVRERDYGPRYREAGAVPGK